MHTEVYAQRSTGADCMATMNLELVIVKKAIIIEEVGPTVSDETTGLLQLLTAQTLHRKDIAEILKVSVETNLEAA